MVWLVSHMWIALGGAAFFGLLLGWSIRGLLLRRKAQTAIVERDIARTELEQAQVEIDGLYAGQRKRAGEGTAGADEAIAALRAREAELSETAAALSAAHAEIERLTSGQTMPAEPAEAVVVDAGAVERLDAGINQSDATLVWRNRFLESRVRGLETSLTDLAARTPAKPVAPVPEPVPAPVEAEPIEVAAPAEQSDAKDAKLRWQTEYLKQRLAVLEASAISAHAAAPVVAAPPPAPEPAAVESSEPVAEAAEDVDEELARLRWRNRYLEGRVAYFEGDAKTAEPETVADAPPEVVEEVVPPVEAPPVEVAEIPAQPHPEPEPPVHLEVAEPQPLPEAEDIGVPEPAEDNTVRTPPIRLDQPHFGAGDDLTSIEGIGPKIEQVLKDDLGVFHFEQIAAWTAENVAWIEEALGFDGRILREAWVDQARALTETEGADA